MHDSFRRQPAAERPDVFWHKQKRQNGTHYIISHNFFLQGKPFVPGFLLATKTSGFCSWGYKSKKRFGKNFESIGKWNLISNEFGYAIWLCKKKESALICIAVSQILIYGAMLQKRVLPLISMNQELEATGT